ncbi:cytochrome P450 [Amycolatopsis cihanbeyliensis]|uniref:Cytochrome P450 n=1 Tax=Amycolatopsis cihanbeyliensis TaxID=1128664 RepID=A0A542DMT5_AMYCI|nr:cytochrome P450 [Amycolatopsis cihanbeyliensis]TQJ04396.1 cytochrome P450 [Amycolatopsis cihanbeyliensis]
MSSAEVSLDFSSDEFLADPWHIYKELRQADPVHWSEAFRAFLVTRYDDVVALLADRQVVSGFPMRSSRRLFGPTLLDADGPRHRELRKLFTPLFAGASVKRLRTEILIPAVDQVLDSIEAEMGSMDDVEIEFMERVAVGVPYAMVTRLFGLPPEDAAWLRPRVLPLAGAIEFPATSLDTAVASKAELVDYLTDKLASRQEGDRMPFLDLVFPPGEPVDESLLGTATLFLLAGTETSVATIGKIMYAILAHDVELSALADSEYRDQVVRETLRWEPPSHTILRYASTDLNIHGVDVPRRSALLLSVGSASRDENTFSDPDTWRPGRPDQRMLAFSSGPHTCLGIQLALAEFDTLFERLSLRFGGVQRSGSLDGIRRGFWRLRERGHIFRRPDHLYVRMERRRAGRSEADA